MTLSNAQGIFALAAMAVGAGLWAARISVNSAIHGAEWALTRLPREVRWSFVVLGLGALLAVLVGPTWVGLGVAYLAGVVAWTAQAVLKNLGRLAEAGAYEPLPENRQAIVVGRVGFWLLIVGALGFAVAMIDFDFRGGVALWDLALVAVVLVAGLLYRRKAAALLDGQGDSAPSDLLLGPFFVDPPAGEDAEG